MNTITQIEIALKAINQATFQTLINHLLYLQGNKFIGAPGAVVGKEKTSKGTPDSFFVNDENYTFVECTTQERIGEAKTFFEKLSKDIDHCFDEDATTIKKELIGKIILGCNEKVSAEEYNSLNAKIKSYNPDAKFEVLNIQNLPMLIYELPKLAEEYLNVQIIKGDIFTLGDFLLKTNKGLQPSLTNEFIGREEELKKSIESLEKSHILLLSGGAGVGKSKLAVKILEELSKEDFIPIVIQSSGVSLWDDYNHLFMPGKQYVILFDDANKSISNLNYLLSKLEAVESYSAKVIITSRDYVKKQISLALNNYHYEEISLSEFKDDEIGNIITTALPNLQYHSDIKRKIVDLAKGNARVALMATYSVTPDSETNYLSSPVLLYEKYFEKISEEINIFNNPIVLKSLAIVSFFGVLDRNNEEIKSILSVNFEIDWNELWTAIMQLHNNEILDVYSNEIVKVSDQVLATYSFYKCFIDEKSAVINYSKWISTFIEKFSNRIRFTLVDANNTFAYYHIQDLVLPHLNEVLKPTKTDKEFYDFYDLFWFYKGRDCLLYLKKWIEILPQEQQPESFNFSYVHNDHTKASKYFELLKRFWYHSNELLRPSLELTLILLEKQPNRLPEILKFIHEDFKYKLDDVEHGYIRQNILLDVLLDSELTDIKKTFANGIFLNLAEVLLHWHFTEYGSAKGMAIRIHNFDLCKSDKLTKLRERILNQVCHLFESENEHAQKVLQTIVYPGGDIDKTIYANEVPIYQKLISEKLDNKKYLHCKFVSVLAKHLSKIKVVYPESWNEFIESDIRKLAKFLKPGWEYRDDKSIEEFEKEKRKDFDNFVKENDWQEIQEFLLNIDRLYRQQEKNNRWHIESSINNIFVSIARKDIAEFEKALRLFFSGKLSFSLGENILNVVILENILTGEEFLRIMDDYDFDSKPYWKIKLVTVLPEEQVNISFLILLINTFKEPNTSIYIYRMLEYLKYEMIFNEYKKDNPELESHNIITFLTSIILTKKRNTRRDFGLDFFVDCSSYFSKFLDLLKDAYWSQYELDSYFDHDGKELKSILDLDRTFIDESLKNGIIDLGYSSNIRLKNINLSVLWEYDEYERLLEELLLTILDKAGDVYWIEEDISSLFKIKEANEDKIKKVKSLIVKLTQKYYHNTKLVLMLIEMVYHRYRDWFVEYFREFLVLNKDIETAKSINFGRMESWSGSRVPLIQTKMEFYQDILKMINTLPNILDYSEHIDYFEQKIRWKKKEVEDEQRKDFMDEYY